MDVSSGLDLCRLLCHQPWWPSGIAPLANAAQAGLKGQILLLAAEGVANSVLYLPSRVASLTRVRT